MRICEIYHSVQGEGLLTGTPSVFVRSSGCNLRCWFCDTPFASWTPEGENRSVAEIVSRVHAMDCRHIVITGGEPMIWEDLIELCSELRTSGKHITIETAGTVFMPLECDLMSISPKMSNSTPTRETAGLWQRRHEETRFRPDIVRQCMDLCEYQLKFVVDRERDAEEVLRFLDAVGGVDRDRVLLMPQGTLVEELDQRAKWLIPWCQRHEVRYCDRAHIRWFGQTRGT